MKSGTTIVSVLVLSVTDALRLDWSVSSFFEKLPLNTVAMRMAKIIIPIPSVMPTAIRNG